MNIFISYARYAGETDDNARALMACYLAHYALDDAVDDFFLDSRNLFFNAKMPLDAFARHPTAAPNEIPQHENSYLIHAERRKPASHSDATLGLTIGVHSQDLINSAVILDRHAGSRFHERNSTGSSIINDAHSSRLALMFVASGDTAFATPRTTMLGDTFKVEKRDQHSPRRIFHQHFSAIFNEALRSYSKLLLLLSPNSAALTAAAAKLPTVDAFAAATVDSDGRIPALNRLRHMATMETRLPTRISASIKNTAIAIEQFFLSTPGPSRFDFFSYQATSTLKNATSITRPRLGSIAGDSLAFHALFSPQYFLRSDSCLARNLLSLHKDVSPDRRLKPGDKPRNVPPVTSVLARPWRKGRLIPSGIIQERDMKRLPESPASWLPGNAERRASLRIPTCQILRFPAPRIARRPSAAAGKINEWTDRMPRPGTPSIDRSGEASLLRDLSLRDFGRNIERLIAEREHRPQPPQPNGRCKK